MRPTARKTLKIIDLPPPTVELRLGVDMLHLDYLGWLKHLGLTTGESVQLETLDSRWLGLFSLMGNYNKAENGTKKA